MKNYRYLLLFAFLLAACSEEQPIFEEFSGVRLSEYITQSNATLQSSPYGWKMTYYPDESQYGGYRFLFKFKENNRVDMASESGDFQESSYRIDYSQGPVLVFDTYNYIHDLANPNDSKGAKATGLSGDYEFIIQKITEDSLQLTGRKKHVNIRLEKATEQDGEDLITIRDLLQCFHLQAGESWIFSVNGKKMAGSIVIDEFKHLYTLNYGTSKLSGSYIMTSKGMIFDKPVSVEIDGDFIDFDGLRIRKEPRIIASNDPWNTLAFTIETKLPVLPVLPAVPVTVENISTYVPNKEIDAISAFSDFKNAGSSTTVGITLMSPKLDAWRATYAAEVPEFTDIQIIMPRSTYDISFAVRYNNGSFWYWGPAATPPTTGFNPMTGDGHNPFYEVSFNITRYSTVTSTPSNYNQDPSKAAVSFRTFLQQPEGFTVIQDGNAFWFRSNADPTDWFKTEP
jgi:hypothetical protein